MIAPYFEHDLVTLYNGDCIDVLRELDDNSIDAVVTDPPYGISFMGKEWDQPGEFGSTSRAGGGPNLKRGKKDAALEAGRYDLSPTAMQNFQHWCEAWAIECLRVLKPGGHVLAFGGSRTWHRLASAVEDAGFESRDSIAWLYGSGFPKSLDVSKVIRRDAAATDSARQWEGWGTALKPSFEPIVVGRKPLIGTVAANVLKHRTGALNIDATRVHTAGSEGKAYTVKRLKPGATLNETGGNWRSDDADAAAYEGETKDGRHTPNVILDESQAAALDEQTGILTSGLMKARTTLEPRKGGVVFGADSRNIVSGDTYGDSGGASRFFPTFSMTEEDWAWQTRMEHLPTFRYEAKAPTSERPSVNGVQHPTVKPLELMRWLCRLVTPPGGVVLEPFAGSGTTIEAAVAEGFRCVAIEREADYLPLIESRLSKPIQQSLFDGWEGTA